MADSKTRRRSLTSTGQTKKKRRNIRIYMIPILALIIVGGAFALYFVHFASATCSDSPASSPPVNFTSTLRIQVENKQGNETRFVVPPSVGVPGGIWRTHQLDSYGVDGHYPVCSDGPSPGGTYIGSTLIYVRSNTVRNFTLGDYFAVWGQPIGPNATFDSSHVIPTAGFQWQMCIGDPGNPNYTTTVQPGHWGNETLTPGKYITLIYFPPSGSGCLG